jgi:Family of unknown function (DUF5906)
MLREPEDHNGKTADAATPPGTEAAAMSDAITVITSIDPRFTGKTYSLAPDGSLIKHVVAWIKEGEGRTIEVPTVAAMVKILHETTQSANQALVLSRFNGDDAIGQPFKIVTEPALESRLGRSVECDGVYKIGNERVAARVKRGMQSSVWVLLDADNPPGMPDEWRVLTLAERLALLEKPLPGVSTCERVEYRGSSARVVKGADKPLEPTHALIRVNDASKIEALREWLKVQTVVEGLSFKSPRYSRLNPGQEIGHEQRTLIDLAVLVPGRLVFNAKPDLAKGLAGYRVIDAGICIVNRGGGPLDIGFAKLPDTQALENYRQKTGMRLTFSQSGSLSSTVIGALKPETEIEVRGVVKPLAEWTATMSVGKKLRCETPFRASCSEAAFITIDKGGDILLHDVGTTTNYVLRKAPEFPDDIDLSDETQEQPGFDASTWAKRLEAMNARFAYVEDRLGGVLDLNGTLMRPFRMLPFEDFYHWFENRPEPGKARSRPLTLAQRWFRDPGRRTHTTAGLYPIGQEPPGALNLWTGLATKAKAGTWPKLKVYLLNVLCADDQGNYEYLRDLLFWKVKNPTERTEVAVLLQGVSGSGKTTFAEKILADIFGRRFFVHHTSPQAAQDSRSEELENCAIALYDECFFGHDLKGKGRVKSLITSPTLMVEPKFVGKYEVKNSLMVVFSSNETAALPIDEDDRRILVLEVARTHAKDRSWFQALRDALDAGELAAFVHEALDADLSGFERTVVPRTAARSALAAATASPEDDFVHHTLEAGNLPSSSWAHGQNAANPNNPWLSGRVAIPTDMLHDAYLEFMRRRHNHAYTRDKEAVWGRFRYALGDAVHPLATRVRKPGGGRGGERFYCYVFEGLDNCRAAYDQHSGRRGDWPDAPGSSGVKPSVRVATLHGRFVSEADARAAADFAKAPPFTL